MEGVAKGMFKRRVGECGFLLGVEKPENGKMCMLTAQTPIYPLQGVLACVFMKNPFSSQTTLPILPYPKQCHTFLFGFPDFSYRFEFFLRIHENQD